MHHARKPKSAPPTRAGTAGASERRSGHRAVRKRGRRRMYVYGAVAAAGLIGASFVSLHAGTTPASAGDSGSPGTSAAALASRTPGPAATPTHAKATTHATATTRTATPNPGAGKDSAGAGNGVFTTAKASGASVGKGKVRRYEVQVEQGTGVSADGAAQEIESVLGDPRGWTADGHDAFQLVSHGPYDFEVKIAGPATVDQICGAAGLHTHGEVNCDVGDQVIVNLKRWNTGSPEFSGPLHEYRALIINHEVGHRIGHGHEGCPGPGRPAPAMMQQIDGLHGCVANAWPYDSHGHYLGGPAVP
jgi:hypothetical protein